MLVPQPLTIKSAILAALKQNLLPGLVLQFFAVLILVVYFFVPESRPLFVWFGEQKYFYGYAYSFVATAIFGGAIPFLYLLCVRQVSATKSALALFCFYTLFWGIKGMEVDLFYRLQGEWFGYNNNFRTIVTKMAVDQFIYSALWAAPSICIIYLWAENNFHLGRWWKALDREFFYVKIPTVVLSNWLVWIPAVSVVYAMPDELQIPLFNLVLCFWVLLLSVLSQKNKLPVPAIK